MLKRDLINTAFNQQSSLRTISNILLALAGFSSLQANELSTPSLLQEEIQHIVVLMLENRSFDNVLAWLYTHEDTTPYFIPENTNPHYLGLSENILPAYTNFVRDNTGQIVFSCPPIKGIPSVSHDFYLNSPATNPHESFHSVKNQIFGFEGESQPTMTGFLQDYASHWDPCTWLREKLEICAVMETYTDKELPILCGLAKHYGVSDLWFSSVPTQTNPNRAFSICGTSEGQIDNGPLGKSLFLSDTIWNRLTEESPETTWMIFWHCDMIPGLFKGPYTSTNTFFNLGKIPNLENHYQRMDAFHDLARKGQLPDFSYIEPQWTLSENLDSRDWLIEAFVEKKDLLRGLQGNDFHPPGDVRTAENLLANIYTSLIANPEAWKKTLFIITFDEHGGIFDHIPPPSSISPDAQCQNGFKFDRYGVRVPTIFISPKIHKNTVIRAETALPFDHTSLIATLLKWKKIDKLQWKMGRRVEAAPTFEKVITTTNPRKDYAISSTTHLHLPRTDNVVQMEDAFYLRDTEGNYLTRSTTFFKANTRMGAAKDKIPLGFVGGSGFISHGSFVIIQSKDPFLGIANVLGTSIFHSDCIYSINSHDAAQWWTIKNVDRPYLGAEIQYGDRVYIENHIYLDPFNYIPVRLMKDGSIFGEFLQARPVNLESGQETYWILEKAGEETFEYNLYPQR